MTIKPIYKTCPICLKQYSWNPDIGQMWCPNCEKKGIPGINEIPINIFKKSIWKKKK